MAVELPALRKQATDDKVNYNTIKEEKNKAVPTFLLYTVSSDILMLLSGYSPLFFFLCTPLERGNGTDNDRKITNSRQRSRQLNFER